MASRLKRRAFESALSRVPPNSEEFFMVKRGFPYFYLDGICERYQQRANANATKSGESPNGNEVQPDDLESNISVVKTSFRDFIFSK